MDRYCKRLIEVDLPIRSISDQARREKSIGHISSLHIWWARRPLAACRAVLCATLWPDPADDLCPSEFRNAARALMLDWATNHLDFTTQQTAARFVAIQRDPSVLDGALHLRRALLDFIADFSDWKHARRSEFTQTAQKLTAAAHAALSGSPDTAPLVLDPFAGGGSIPVEALRVGADVFASDLNPVPVLLNRVLVELIPKYGESLVKTFEEAGAWIGRQARQSLAELYPSGQEHTTPIAYLWAKTIRCEGPSCGAQVPVIRSLWLEKKGSGAAYLVLTSENGDEGPNVHITVSAASQGKTPHDGTVRRGSVECPVCKYVIPRARVEEVSKTAGLGERLVAVVSRKEGATGRVYRAATVLDEQSLTEASRRLEGIADQQIDGVPLVPDEELPYLRSIFNVHVYGVNRWAALFNDRQLFTCLTISRLVRDAAGMLKDAGHSDDLAEATSLLLALAADRQINALNRTCYWNATGPKMQAGFARQAIPMFWDYCEANPFGGSVGSWESMLACVAQSFDALRGIGRPGLAQSASATEHPLPDDSVDAVVTDPPYYDAVPYADLSDFFYVWLKRMIGDRYPELFAAPSAPKKLEIVQLAERNPKYSYKTRERFEQLMTQALTEARRVAKPSSLSVIVFAHQSTAGWEAMLSALIKAGWVVTASWPIDTEMPTRVRAANSAVLASSVHLACRPRETADGSLIEDSIGDWRQVLDALPIRIHEWLPRLAEEGVVGADAIFACLGPALEVFSRYSSVEKASGAPVDLREYLEEVWAAVSREALSMIFKGADASGFEEDARLTAMWLWTLHTTANGDAEIDIDDKGKALRGYSLEYDAARKIAQGLGVHLEDLHHLVETKGEIATLLSAAARTKYLFGSTSPSGPKRRPKKKEQLTLNFTREIEELDEENADWAGEFSSRSDPTVLDQVHQAMILFGASRGEALRRLVADEGVGNNPLFWRLAQALSALYPGVTEEKRWIDGVLARKKGLGF